MGMLGEWRAARDRRRLAASYLQSLLPAADPADLHWLAAIASSAAVAERELGFARRALALVVSERDALDDQTASDVAHELMPVTESEARQSPATGLLWAARWREYAGALAMRGTAEPPAERLAKVLLAGADVDNPSRDQLTRATQCMHAIRARANEALRAAFGAASLPDDVRPSALR
jgi:hypothetical protein